MDKIAFAFCLYISSRDFTYTQNIKEMCQVLSIAGFKKRVVNFLTGNYNEQLITTKIAVPRKGRHDTKSCRDLKNIDQKEMIKHDQTSSTLYAGYK